MEKSFLEQLQARILEEQGKEKNNDITNEQDTNNTRDKQGINKEASGSITDSKRRGISTDTLMALRRNGIGSIRNAERGFATNNTNRNKNESRSTAESEERTAESEERTAVAEGSQRVGAGCTNIARLSHESSQLTEKEYAELKLNLAREKAIKAYINEYTQNFQNNTLQQGAILNQKEITSFINPIAESTQSKQEQSPQTDSNQHLYNQEKELFYKSYTRLTTKSLLKDAQIKEINNALQKYHDICNNPNLTEYLKQDKEIIKQVETLQTMAKKLGMQRSRER
ncbi:hypothetical protein CQA53_05690 [Helicobacter didelphidarum]|uniref:Uncharacterized protein n=1 Tax=Helicobacter didelphidarum TaxID=2040648 RepID=A0A3D8ILG6_9HELI|nr:hypothetical protein [Helicobacter didelphidarum]RDU65785.1 hypothetical protein CQA53_05690 [Helicobacter didelphidarum]